MSISKRFRKIIVLIDTLDECDDTDVRDVLSLLNELQGLPKTFVQLFLTSRSHTTRSAEQAFKNAQPITIMNITATQSDLENFAGRLGAGGFDMEFRPQVDSAIEL